MSRVIEIEDLAKRYKLGGVGFYRYKTIRESLAGSIMKVARRAEPEPVVWALRDVTLAVQHGEVLGIIGRNGAGKTTLLRVVARITEPTEGVCRTRGRVGALLDVGTGLHPELTGRENVYLSGAILGMSRREIARRFDDIVSFAELERFLDTPLKRYSAGMYLRLAFAVAAHLESEILVVDEVLAVGDAEFQQKCLGRMSEFTSQGRTVLFVSHDLGAVARLCSRVVWLDGGRVLADGQPAEVIAQYLESAPGTVLERAFASDPDSPVEIRSVAVVDRDGAPLDAPVRTEPLSLEVQFLVRERIPAFDLAFYVLTSHGARVLDEAWSDTGRPTRSAGAPGDYVARLVIPPVLAAGDYVMGVWIGAAVAPAYETYFDREVLSFRVWPHPQDRAEWTQRGRIVHPPVEWRVMRRSAPRAARVIPSGDRGSE